MASIVSSQIAFANQQVDGQTIVQEIHVDSLGVSHAHTYMAPPGADLQANLAAYAAGLLSNLVADEISVNLSQVQTLGAAAQPTFAYSTPAQNLAALRSAYANFTRQDAILTGEYLSSLTDTQLQNAFGIPAGQVAALRSTKLTPAANLAASIRAASGT